MSLSVVYPIAQNVHVAASQSPMGFVFALSVYLGSLTLGLLKCESVKSSTSSLVAIARKGCSYIAKKRAVSKTDSKDIKGEVGFFRFKKLNKRSPKTKVVEKVKSSEIIDLRHQYREEINKHMETLFAKELKDKKLVDAIASTQAQVTELNKLMQNIDKEQQEFLATSLEISKSAGEKLKQVLECERDEKNFTGALNRIRSTEEHPVPMEAIMDLGPVSNDKPNDDYDEDGDRYFSDGPDGYYSDEHHIETPRHYSNYDRYEERYY